MKHAKKKFKNFELIEKASNLLYNFYNCPKRTGSMEEYLKSLDPPRKMFKLKLIYKVRYELTEYSFFFQCMKDFITDGFSMPTKPSTQQLFIMIPLSIICLQKYGITSDQNQILMLIHKCKH